MTSRFRCLAFLLFVAALPLTAQSVRNATVVYTVGAEATMPVPVFTRSEEASEDLADQLFLHLVTYAPNARGTADNQFAPSLARAWHRIDPVTLTFDIDPRARWQDGVPVLAHDVVYTWTLLNNPKTGADRARLAAVTSVEATDEHTVRVRFREPSAEQVYTFGFLMQPLPAHLLEKMAPEAISTSAYARKPIGDGPYRFERRTAGVATELRADSTFFLGRPTITRLVFRVAADPTARINTFLTGESDVLDKIPTQSVAQVQTHAGGKLYDVPSNNMIYLLYNLHNPVDTSRPHPIFNDVRVREALSLALDRNVIAQATFGAATMVPDAPQSQLWSWISGGSIKGASQNVARAQALLAQAGWRDGNGDGVLDRNGVPLHFVLLVATSSAPANQIALLAQQAWRKIGVDMQIEPVEGPVIGARAAAGQFDMVYRRALQDPTPSSLVQAWSCDGARQPSGGNYARWCDSTFDRMLHVAATAKNQPAAYREVLARVTLAHPAIFMAAPSNAIAVSSRYDNVTLWPSRTWLSVWQWRVRPSAALPRDR
jgi:peptide/nickel transport system substrate-binding protein